MRAFSLNLGTCFRGTCYHASDSGASGVSGGAPRPGLSVSAARAGDALLFYNLGADGALDELSLHAGCRVTGGVPKFVANKWIANFPQADMLLQDGLPGFFFFDPESWDRAVLGADAEMEVVG